MPEQNAKPVVFYVYSNDRSNEARHLRNLPDEARAIREELDRAEDAGLCELVERANATIDDVLEVFEDPEYINRIAMFHFAGHAGGFRLLLESSEGKPAVAHARGLAEFLAQQRGLELVFLNGCSTEPQTNGLLNAGVNVVISTSQVVKDKVARDFAMHFYRNLGVGRTIEEAYELAVGAVTLGSGGKLRDFYETDDETVNVVAADRFPWQMHPRPGAEEALKWNLPDAADDPLFDLPAPEERDLPPDPSPYREMEWFEGEDAEIFFGRDYDIRKLYLQVMASVGAPIILLYGQSGVGKSSLLAAGLRPRLERVCGGVCYERRDQANGLLFTLKTALGYTPDETALRETWLAREAESGKPYVVILDQVEEVYTRPNDALPNEIKDFTAALVGIFKDANQRPKGRLILSFREERLAEMAGQLDMTDTRLPYTRVQLGPLDKRGIIRAVIGPTGTKPPSDRLKSHFRLEIDDGLAEIIADDLLTDAGAAVAPMLQILLSKMWEQVKGSERRVFTWDLYQGNKYKGTGKQYQFRQFLEERLQGLRAWHSEVVDSGLALDVLEYHTTLSSTAEQRTEDDIRVRYSHQPVETADLVKECKTRRLLADLKREDDVEAVRGSRLAHDLLAPLVREQFGNSDKPGQQARRFLEIHTAGMNGQIPPEVVVEAHGWRLPWKRASRPLDEAKGPRLDSRELKLALLGKSGMRNWDAAEEWLVDTSSREVAQEMKRRRRRKRLELAALITIVVTAAVAVVLAAIAMWQWQVAEDQGDEVTRNVRIVRDQSLIANANSLRYSDPLLALALAFEANMAEHPVIGAQETLADLAYAPGARRRIVMNAEINAVTFSPDDKAVLVAAADGTVTLWDVQSGAQRQSYGGRGGKVFSVAFSPDGNKVVAGGEKGSVIVWDTATGERLQRFEGLTGKVRSVAFSPDGSQVVAGGDDGKVMLWDAVTGDEIQRFEGDTDEIFSVAFSPDGSKLVAGGADGKMMVWDVAESTEPRYFEGHTDDVFSVAFSPDGITILSGSGDTQMILWDVQSGTESRRFEASITDVLSVAFSPNGNFAVSGTLGSSIILWDVHNGEDLRRFTGHMDRINSVAFDSTGHTIASGSGSDDKTLIIWDVDNQAAVRRSPGPGLKEVVLALNPQDENMVLFSGCPKISDCRKPSYGRLFLWDLKADAEIRHFGGIPDLAGISASAFSPDGHSIVSASYDGSLFVWNTDTAQLVKRLTGQTGTAFSVAYDPDGSRILSGGCDTRSIVCEQSELILWDAKTGALIYPFASQSGAIHSVAFSPDGLTALTASSNGSLTLWNVPVDSGDLDQEIIWTIEGHNGPAEAVFSPDGQMLLSNSVDKEVALWDAKTLENIYHFKRHDDPVEQATFSPDGKLALSVSDDGTLIVWDVETGEVIRRFEVKGTRIISAVFSLDGQTIVSATSAGEYFIWRIDSFKKLLDWTVENRYLHEFDCDDRTRFGLPTDPFCSKSDVYPTRTPFASFSSSGG